MIMRRFLTIPLAALAAGALSGQTLEHRISFPDAKVAESGISGYDRITITGLPLSNIPGAPLLPVKYVNLLLPPGARAVSVDVVYSDEKRMEGAFLPAPGRRETPLSEKPGKQAPGPDRAIYDSREAYPASQAELVHQGSMGGLGAATVKVYPARYRGAERELLRSTEVVISLRLARGNGPDHNGGRGAIRELAGRLVENRRDIDAWYPEVRDKSGKNGSCDLLIITGAPFDTVLLRLANWKSSRGLVSKIITTDSIYSGYPGSDRQEKIRNYIREHVQTLGVSYVILGGDTAVVPARVTYAMASGYDSLAPGRDSLRADLYYSDLDGTWDANGNGLYGEMADSVDMYPDVVVGRAPINSVADAQTFVRKVMEYEQGAMSDFLDRASLWAEMLDYETDGAAAAQILDRDHLTPYFKPAEKLYETSGNQTRASTLDAYRQGRHLVNHVGHAWYTSMNVGPGFTGVHEIRAGDFDTIPTGGRWGIIYSIGCMPAAIERSCLAERYVNSPQGGGAAFIGNCSYGWYLPYFAGYGSSDLYNQQFFQKLLAENSPALGMAHTAAKAQFIGAAQGENEFRWIMYGLNLIGDPTLAVWTGEAESLGVLCADSLTVGQNSLAVAVLKNGRPQAEAAVTIIGDSTYGLALTDGTGHALVPVLPSAGDTLKLTATARNSIPFEKSIPVFSSGAQVSLLGWQAAELAGNGDGLAGPGEEIALSFWLKNTGSQGLGDSLHIALSRSDSNSVLLDSAFSMAAPAPGESLWTGPAASFLADSGLADGDAAAFNLTAMDSAGTFWNFAVGVPLAAPRPAFAGYSVDDRSGNGNGVPEPGETVTLYVEMTNKGGAALEGAAIRLTSVDPYVAVTDSSAFPEPLLADSNGSYAFQIFVDPAMPGPWRAPVFEIRCEYEWKEWRDSFSVAAGQVGLTDDMETGSPGWQADGGWHLSGIRSHSPSHSWYFGSETDTLAPQYSVDTLESPPFAVGPGCSLGWWQWHDFVPGWSWGVVEICGGFGARLLEVVEGRSAGWTYSGHDLSRYPPGTVLSLRFIAVCDSVRSEGWHIDDVNAFGPPSGTAAEPPAAGRPTFALHTGRPNPASNRAAISFCLPQAGQASLKVYNVQGQLVRTLVNGARKAGANIAVWDCRDDRGRAVAGGVYLYRLSAGGFSSTRQMAVIR